MINLYIFILHRFREMKMNTLRFHSFPFLFLPKNSATLAHSILAVVLRSRIYLHVDTGRPRKWPSCPPCSRAPRSSSSTVTCERKKTSQMRGDSAANKKLLHARKEREGAMSEKERGTEGV